MAVTNNAYNNQRHIFGDMATRFYNLTGTGSGDTFTVSIPSGDMLSVDVQPTTSISVGATWAAGSTQGTTLITFAASGAWSAVVQVISRAG